MKFVNKIAFAALAVVSATAVSSAVFADEPYNTVGCLHMAHKVADALSANQSSPNFKAASDEDQAGRSFCQSGVYNVGIAHYAKALDLLGVSKS